jgi:hypothetical protein
MTLRTCSRQPEVLELLALGHWPHACSPELRTHLSECRACAELLLVTQAFQGARASTAAQAQLPAPGAIWWRAQLRRRNAAVERVGKPMLGAYVFALSMTLVVAVTAVISQARHGFRWLDWLGQSQISTSLGQAFNPSAWLSSGGSLAILIPVLATVALVGAVVVYLTVERP